MTLMAVALTGCSRFYVDWDHWAIRRTPEVVAKPATPAAAPTRVVTVPPPAQSASIHKHKHKHPAPAAPDMKDMSIQPETTQTSPVAPAPATISMASPGGSSDAAEKDIEAAGKRLAGFDRARLSGPTLATYEQANGFLSQGKEALEEKDYVAASGFAQKASVLTDKLQASVTAH
jgi:hypothetical protein